MTYLVWIAVILTDLITKISVLNHIKIGEIIPVFKGFNLILTFNTGVSFSLFSSNSTVGPLILSAVGLIIAGVVFIWMKREKNRLAQVALALIFGGAIGNVIDRIRFGAVVDFLDVYVGPYHWPAFNVADSAICIGAGLLIIQTLIKPKEHTK